VRLELTKAEEPATPPAPAPNLDTPNLLLLLLLLLLCLDAHNALLEQRPPPPPFPLLLLRVVCPQ
jgi:hypothetical protein